MQSGKCSGWYADTKLVAPVNHALNCQRLAQPSLPKCLRLTLAPPDWLRRFFSERFVESTVMVDGPPLLKLVCRWKSGSGEVGLDAVWAWAGAGWGDIGLGRDGT